ncbi:MAG: hypothetical protein JO006_03465 [Paucibacter sp.]|nr:hypothetical protein [Roseateles sp.]
MHAAIAPAPKPLAGRLLSPRAAAFQLLEAAALAGYSSAGRAGLTPILSDGQPAYREDDVQAVAGLIRHRLEAA